MQRNTPTKNTGNHTEYSFPRLRVESAQDLPQTQEWKGAKRGTSLRSSETLAVNIPKYEDLAPCVPTVALHVRRCVKNSAEGRWVSEHPTSEGAGET